jgi:LPS-assembly lipoprotein
MKITSLKLFLIASLLLSLTACGFHLRGHEPLPPQLRTLYLESSDPYGEFTKQLQQVFRSIGVTLVQTSQAAPVTLQILSESTGQQFAGQGVSGLVTTYVLSANATYQLLDAHGGVVQAPQTVTTTRNYTVNSNQVLGDLNVQSGLQDDMQRDLINQLLNRLRSRGTARALAAS